MATLREITNNLKELYQKAADPEEPFDAVLDTIEMLELDFMDKADDYGALYTQWDSDAKQIREEERRLAQRRRRIEDCSEKLKEKLGKAMSDIGQKKIQTNLYTFAFRKTKQVVVDNIDEVPFECLSIKDPTANLVEIRKWIKENGPVDWAHIEESESFSIK